MCFTQTNTSGCKHINLQSLKKNKADVCEELFACKMKWSSVLDWKTNKTQREEQCCPTNFRALKALDTLVNCQRQVCPKIRNKTTTCEQSGFSWSLKLQENNERKKHPCWKKLCAFKCLNKFKKTSGQKPFNILVRNYLFLKNIVTLRGNSFS